MIATAQYAILAAAAIAGAVALLGSAYNLVLALVGAFTTPRVPDLGAATASKRFLIFVPAHNEEVGIQPTLASLRTLNYPKHLYRVIVIADNCTDSTAEVVRQLGCECWERRNEQERGKGYALRWAFDRAAGLDYDAAVVIDADSQAHADLLGAFDLELANGALAAQAVYEFRSNSAAYVGTSTVIGKNAENSLWWRPRRRLGLAIHLQGNGFCLSRRLLREVPWSAYSIVEDLEYSLELAVQNARVAYVESTPTVARSVDNATTATPQRLRWASGTFQVICRWLPRTLFQAIRQRSWYLAETAWALLFSSRMLLIYLTLMAAVLSFSVSTRAASVIRMATTAAFGLQFLYLLVVLRTCVPRTSPRFNPVGIAVYLGWLSVVQGLALIGIRRNIWTRTVR